MSWQGGRFPRVCNMRNLSRHLGRSLYLAVLTLVLLSAGIASGEELGCEKEPTPTPVTLKPAPDAAEECEGSSGTAEAAREEALCAALKKAVAAEHRCALCPGVAGKRCEMDVDCDLDDQHGNFLFEGRCESADGGEVRCQGKCYLRPFPELPPVPVKVWCFCPDR